MKIQQRVFFFFCFYIGLVSCQKASTIGKIDGYKQDVFTRSSVDYSFIEDSLSFQVSESVARDVILSNDGNVEIKSVIPYEYKGVTSFYIINLEEGWRIVSADLRTKAILAKGEKGSFPMYFKEKSSISFWLDDLASQIHYLQSSSNTTVDISWGIIGRRVVSSLRVNRWRSDPVNPDSVWVVLLDCSDTTVMVQANVPHLMVTKWGQETPWNSSFPTYLSSDGFTYKHYLTGCVPTALAQILYYFNQYSGRPSGLYHLINLLSTITLYNNNYVPFGVKTVVSRSDYRDSTSRWDSMPLDSISALSNSVGAGYVSDLMLDIGNRLDAIYTPSCTSVSSTTGEVNLSPCNISYSWSQYDSSFKRSLVFFNLQNSKPVLVTAVNTDDEGHMWVIDGGYMAQTTIENYYCFRKVPYDYMISHYWGLSNFVEFFISLQDLRHFYPNAPLVLNYADIYYDRYFLMNWGYNGFLDDGFYSCSISDNWPIFTGAKSIYYGINPSSSFLYNPS